MPSSQPLPPAEANLFKKILKTYEQKQYKKGLQYVKEILKKFPDHGETLSMKGLILNYTNRKAEAYECAQRGLRHDVKSHVCWHVYGLLQRSDRKYDEAIKCYRNALKCDKDNLQILRDLSLLQIQIRDLEGYRDTRYQLFQLRPTQRASWIGYGMSYHLLRDYETALSILEEFAKTQQAKPYDYEHSEFLLYQNTVLREAGRYRDALDHINNNESNIVDKLAVVELKADIHLKLGEADKAAQLYTDLIERNPDGLAYYKKLQTCKNLSTVDEQKEFCKSFEAKYPRADIPRKLPLDFLTDNEFRQQVDKYMQRALRKGVPPLFKELKYLYKDLNKLKIVETLCLEYVESLSNKGTFNDVEVEQKDKEPPTCLLWTYYYLAQHYDYLNDTENAFKYINLAIDHTPTLVELYMIKGKIFKHAGNLYEAVRWLDEAQSLDTADRYINYKCSKYMLRANLIKESEVIAGKFTREGAVPFEYLKEMQCMWFETECANAYKRLSKYGEALKKCHQVERHFQEIIEDQFDFHSYCMRKMTLRSYVDMLRLEDQIKSHPFFFKAAQTAIQIYISLHDKPLSDEEDDKIENTENLTPSELRKLKNKQKKQQLKDQVEKEKEKQLKEKQKALNKAKNKEDGDLETINEEDLVPEKLERPENPLEECSKFLKPLEEFAVQHMETHVLAFEVYSRKKRFLLMLKCLKRMKQINAEHPKFHYYLSKFLITYNNEKSNLNDTLKEVITEELKELYNGKNVEQLNEEFLQKYANSLEHVVEGAKILYSLNPSQNQTKAVQLVTNTNDNLTGRLFEVCSEVYVLLKQGDFGKLTDKQLDDYRLQCKTLWQYANVFQTAEELTNCIEQTVGATSNGDATTTSEQLADKLQSTKISGNDNQNEN